jgi:25S rRNA (uracil2634-N3)-methyltransferase
MSKSKTKRLRREAKRETQRKVAAAQRKAIKAAKTATKPQPSKVSANAKPGKKPLAQTQAPAEDATETKKQKQPQPQQRRRTEVPFGEYDNILLVGEGMSSIPSQDHRVPHMQTYPN